MRSCERIGLVDPWPGVGSVHGAILEGTWIGREQAGDRTCVALGSMWCRLLSIA